MPVYNQDVLAFLAEAEQPISQAQVKCAEVLCHSERFDQKEVDAAYAFVLGVLAKLPGGSALAKDWTGMNAPPKTGVL